MTADISAAVAGAVLAGGRSTRMGTDKAAMDLDGRPMVAWVIQLFRDAGVDRIVIAGGDAELASRLEVEHIYDRHPGIGPLAGLDTALTIADLVLVTPCDVPYVNPSDLRRLLAALSDSHHDVVCLAGPLGREPLISAWRSARCRPALDLRLRSQNRSVRALLDDLDVGEVPIADAASLRNLNKASDLLNRPNH